MKISLKWGAAAGTLMLLAPALLTALPVNAAVNMAIAPPPSSSACGTKTIAKSDGSTWKCTFGDDFGARTLDGKKWIAQETANSGFHSGPECFVNTAKNVSLSGGFLNLTVRKEAAPFTCSDPYGNYTTQYTSGMVSTWARFSQAFGRFEIRAKFPAAKVAGLQSALWLFPQDSKYGGWPYSGEIDIAETYSLHPDRAIPYIHYAQDAPDPTVTNNYCMIADLSAFHTYVAEWTTSSITIKFDGVTCMVHNWNPAAPLVKPAPFDQPFMVALTQALGVGGNAFDPATTPLPATTQIDYVRVWS